MAKKNTKTNFEAKMNRLEKISVLLDNEEIDLEEAIKLYEEGITLSKECMAALKHAELKITELKDSADEISPEEELSEE